MNTDNIIEPYKDTRLPTAVASDHKTRLASPLAPAVLRTAAICPHPRPPNQTTPTCQATVQRGWCIGIQY